MHHGSHQCPCTLIYLVGYSIDRTLTFRILLPVHRLRRKFKVTHPSTHHAILQVSTGSESTEFNFSLRRGSILQKNLRSPSITPRQVTEVSTFLQKKKSQGYFHLPSDSIKLKSVGPLRRAGS